MDAITTYEIYIHRDFNHGCKQLSIPFESKKTAVFKNKTLIVERKYLKKGKCDQANPNMKLFDSEAIFLYPALQVKRQSINSYNHAYKKET